MIGCDDGIHPPMRTDELTELESMLVGVWNYQVIIVDDILNYHATQENEPRLYGPQAGGARSEIRRRYIQYNADRTYQIGGYYWGFYQLGTIGDINWQPSFGNWEIDDSGGLIHNSGLKYEVEYKIELTDTSFRRSHNRLMSEDYDFYPDFTWKAQEIKPFSEIFGKDADQEIDRNRKSSLTLELSVDMHGYDGSFTTVYVSGDWNDTNWTEKIAMADEDQDSTWEINFDVHSYNEIQYKFHLDDWEVEESLIDGAICTKTTGAFINRRIVVIEDDFSVETVCWEECVACQ